MSKWDEEEVMTGEPETIEQRKCMIQMAYEQLGALTWLRELRLRYDILEISPVHFDMSFKTGLKAMKPCVSSLRFLDIMEVMGCKIGGHGLEWMFRLVPKGLDIAYMSSAVKTLGTGEAGNESVYRERGGSLGWQF
ncbi:hypothetical protein BGZ81_009380 [Podila clonocystis]|nr:hypothetical protein BGZ81_009380 [Podila clonocystis]